MDFFVLASLFVSGVIVYLLWIAIIYALRVVGIMKDPREDDSECKYKE